MIHELLHGGAMNADRDKRRNFERDEQRMMDEKLYKVPLASPTRQEHLVMDVLPDYMLNKEAMKHAEIIKNQKQEDKPIKEIEKKEDKDKQNLQELDGQSPNKGGPGGQYDAFAASIKYSLGLASIMNKYNIASTNDIADYKNNDIFIKTKKGQPLLKSQFPPINSQQADKTGNVNTSSNQNQAQSKLGTTTQAIQDERITNTLIFVQKRDRELDNGDDKDLMSTLVSLNIKPTNYILSKHKIDLHNTGTGQSKNENLPKINEQEKHKYVAFKNTQVEGKKKLFEELIEFENVNYTNSILKSGLFEREEEETTGNKKKGQSDKKGDRSKTGDNKSRMQKSVAGGASSAITGGGKGKGQGGPTSDNNPSSKHIQVTNKGSSNAGGRDEGSVGTRK